MPRIDSTNETIISYYDLPPDPDPVDLCDSCFFSWLDITEIDHPSYDDAEFHCTECGALLTEANDGYRNALNWSEIIFIEGGIYTTSDGDPYDPEYPSYPCLSPARDIAEGINIFDCWIVDKNGKRCPGYNASPVPINASNIGKLINIKRF